MKEALEKATRTWVAEFTHVPASVIKKMAVADEDMYSYDSDSLRLVASPRITCSSCSTEYTGKFLLTELMWAAKAGCPIPCEHCSLHDSWVLGTPEYAFPCGWGTLFAPNDGCDLRWFDEHRDEVAQLGFFVFESDDYGILLGIDAGGFDFYDAYWIPLYRLRGLRWHEAEEDEEN